MKITFQFFGQLRHMADADEVVLETVEHASLSDALQQLASAYEAAFAHIVFDDEGAIRPSLMIMINEQPVNKNAPPRLQNGDVVTLLPAISGG